MEASTSNGSDDVKTFRGRSLEELLPQIRAELGPGCDRAAPPGRTRRRGRRLLPASLRRGRRARAARRRAPARDPLRPRHGRGSEFARRPGAVRAGDAVRRRARRRRARHADGGRHVLRHGPAAAVPAEPEPEPDEFFEAPTGLYGPQPNVSAIREAAPTPDPEPEPVAPPPAAGGRDADGDAADRRRRRRGPPDRRRPEPVAGRRRGRRGRRARAAVLHAAQPQEADPRRAGAPDPGHDRARARCRARSP